MRPVFLPLIATLIFRFPTRTLHPNVKDLLCIFQILHNHEACIHHRNAVRVAQITVVIERVTRHCKRGSSRNVPAIEEPLEGQMEVSEGGVGIEEDNKFVVGK